MLNAGDTNQSLILEHETQYDSPTVETLINCANHLKVQNSHLTNQENNKDWVFSLLTIMSINVRPLLIPLAVRTENFEISMSFSLYMTTRNDKMCNNQDRVQQEIRN